jgi:hypothetical protein
MAARAKLFGHPIHQDAHHLSRRLVRRVAVLQPDRFLAADRPSLMQASFYMNAAGILGGPFLAIDFLPIPLTQLLRVLRIADDPSRNASGK